MEKQNNASSMPAWPWAVVSVILGCWIGVGFRVLAPDLVDVTEHWIGIWAAAGLCAMVLSPLLDVIGARHRSVVLLMGLSLLLVLWTNWAEPQRGLSGILTGTLVFFSCALLVHFSAVAQLPRGSRIAAASLGFSGFLAMAWTTWTLAVWLEPNWTKMVDTAILAVSLPLLIGIFLHHIRLAAQYHSDETHDHTFKVGLELFKPAVRAAHLLFLGFTGLIFASMALVCSGNPVFGLADLSLPTVSSSSFYLSAFFVLGSLSARTFLRRMGVRRALAFAMLIWVAVVLGYVFTTSQTQTEFLAMITSFFSGLVLTCIMSLSAGIALPNQATALVAWFCLAATVGASIGIYAAQAQVTKNALISAAICHLLALVALHLIRFAPASSPVRFEAETLQSSVEKFESDWPGETKSGLSMHRFSSRLGQALSRICVEIFFGKVRVDGLEHLAASQKGILVANHPNSFLDAILITAIFPGRLHLLTKSPLSGFPILGSILDQLGAIPFSKRLASELSGTSVESGSLRQATQILRQSGHILIFPEGVSQPDLNLKPIKTEIARLAFHFGRESGWETQLNVIPIGLDYSEPTVFRSAVHIRIDRPMDLSTFQSVCQSMSSSQVIRSATYEISERLKSLIPHLDDSDLEHLTHMIHQLYGEKARSILDVDDEEEVRRAIEQAVGDYQQLDPDAVRLFFQRIHTYFDQLERLATPQNHPPIPKRQILAGIRTAFSPATLGLIVNWLPYKITGEILERLTPSSVWIATGKIVVGLGVFSLYYFLITFLGSIFLSPIGAYFLVLIFLFSGVLALGSLDRFAFRIQQLKTLWKAFWTQNTDQELDEMRIKLIQDLERFRESNAYYAQKDTSDGGSS